MLTIFCWSRVTTTSSSRRVPSQRWPKYRTVCAGCTPAAAARTTSRNGRRRIVTSRRILPPCEKTGAVRVEAAGLRVRSRIMTRRAMAGAGLAALPLFAPYLFTQTMTRAPADRSATVNAVFSRWSAATPGCAVGVGVNGTPVLERAYGMADLEHDVPNTPQTIFEAGSVSKQFTAAAVLLLAREGKL